MERGLWLLGILKRAALELPGLCALRSGLISLFLLSPPLTSTAFLLPAFYIPERLLIMLEYKESSQG